MAYSAVAVQGEYKCGSRLNDFHNYMANKRISVDLPDELYRRLKLLCYTEDLKLGDTIRKCVENFCNEQEAHMIKIVDERSAQ
jgi:hypothetical protein